MFLDPASPCAADPAAPGPTADAVGSALPAPAPRWPRSLPPWHYEVTARDIRRFRQAIGEPGDDGAAPPLFCQVMAYRDAGPGELGPDGAPVELRAALDEARTVGGASDFTVHRPVRAGELIEVRVTLLGATRKLGRQGPLDLVEVETVYADATGVPVARELATYVQRAAPAANAPGVAP
jgi:N-terminal half of MaoC dehydratase